MTVRRFLLGVLVLATALGAAVQAAYPPSPAEQQAYDLMQKEGAYVKAREVAESVLKVDHRSFVAYYVIGAVYFRAEGSLPRAYYFLQKSRRMVEREWGSPLPASGPWLWHARILEELIDVTAEMDRYEEELDLLALHDRLYVPPLPSSWGWPLMKLGRMEEARAKIAEALKSDKPGVITHAMNTLGAIENECDDPQKAYEVYTQLVAMVRQKNWDMHAVYLRNAGATALSLLKYEDGERLLLDSAKYFDPGTFTNPWRTLAVLYVDEGRIPEAISAVREMHAWSHRTLPSLDQQSWAERQLVTAAILLESGYTQEALSIARRVLNRPDRRGGTSLHADQSEAGLLLFYHYALRVEAQRLREEMSWCDMKQWARDLIELSRVEVEAWSSGRRASAMIVHHGRLGPSIRPSAPDAIALVDWTRPELSEILGPGVVGAETERLLKRTGPMADLDRPFLLVTEGHADYLRGRDGEAKEALEAALQELPPAEVLQRAQTNALLGKVLEREGDLGGALAHDELAMEKAPSVFRSFGLALPCKVSFSGGDAARMAAAMLEGSPRFEVGRGGFSVRINQTGALVYGSLLAPDGTVLCQMRSPAARDPEAAARLFCQEFHRRAFAPKVDLSQTDITSLEGSNLTGDEVRDQLRDLFLPGDASPAAPGRPTPSPR